MLMVKLEALRQMAADKCQHNEILLKDLVEVSAAFCTRADLRDLIQRGMEHHFIDRVRANAGIVLTFSNLGPRFEMMTSGEVLAELG